MLLGTGILGAAVSFWRHRYTLAFWCSVFGCGCAIALQLPPEPPLTGWYPPVPATVTGTVRSVLKANAQQLWCIVDGQLFPQRGKPIIGSILLKIWKADSVTGTVAATGNTTANI